MSYKNLRILYNNVADSATLSANTTASASYTVNNLKNDLKGLVHRSTQKSVAYTLQWDTTQQINCIVLPYTNLTKTAAFSIAFYTTKTDNTPAYTYSGSVKQYDIATPLIDLEANSVSTYSYGGGRCISMWSDSWAQAVVACQKIVLTLTDNNNSQTYLEVSRILCGTYWSPVYNTKFGIQVTHSDQSEQNRTEAGNLITTNKPIFKSLSFDLEWLPPQDRTTFVNMVKTVGIRKPIFVSIFPEDSDTYKESEYEIYGKFSDSPTITHPMFTVYATSVRLDEI